MHLVLHILGLDDASGRFYLFWSGIGADLGLFSTPFVLWFRHTCEIPRCPRLGRHTTAAGARLCRKHHPDGPLTVEQAHAAHEEASR